MKNGGGGKTTSKQIPIRKMISFMHCFVYVNQRVRVRTLHRHVQCVQSALALPCHDPVQVYAIPRTCKYVYIWCENGAPAAVCKNASRQYCE